MTTWVPDVLGAGFEQTTLDLGEDSEGPVVATLVRATGMSQDAPAILYVHGFNDYFFQRHLAERCQDEGYAFYALDLRKCGRSLLPGQTAHFCTELTDYHPELSLAARLLRYQVGHPRLMVLAHSTGALTASLWAHSIRRTGALDAIVLNSPWFDLNARWFHRVVATRVLTTVGPLDPMRVVANGRSAYSHHLHVSNGGRWDYDLRLKPPEGFPVRAGWLRAVRRGQARLARGLEITAPVLVARASASGPNSLDNPDLDRQDTVLDVRHIAARAPLLGPDVTQVVVEDGIHDLCLSAEGPREEYFAAVFTWLATRLPQAAAPDAVSLSR